MSKIFVTSDTWFNRPNGKYLDLTTDEYNKILTENWNKTVGKKDIVYILGGIGISDIYQILIKLNGEIHILNNYFSEDEKYFIEILKKSVDLSVDRKLKNKIIFEETQILTLADEDVILSYFPLMNWMGSESGTYCFHGLTTESDLINHRISCMVGNWDYKPACINEIKNKINSFKEKTLF